MWRPRGQHNSVQGSYYIRCNHIRVAIDEIRLSLKDVIRRWKRSSFPFSFTKLFFWLSLVFVMKLNVIYLQIYATNKTCNAYVKLCCLDSKPKLNFHLLSYILSSICWRKLLFSNFVKPEVIQTFFKISDLSDKWSLDWICVVAEIAGYS